MHRISIIPAIGALVMVALAGCGMKITDFLPGASPGSMPMPSYPAPGGAATGGMPRIHWLPNKQITMPLSANTDQPVRVWHTDTYPAIAQRLGAQPPGRRWLYLYDGVFEEWLINQPANPYPNVDAGIARVKGWWKRVLAVIADRGLEVDGVILDYEESGFWGGNIKPLIERGKYPDAMFGQRDLGRLLREFARGTRDQRHRDAVIHFSRENRKLLLRAWNEAICEPVWERWPNAQISDWDTLAIPRSAPITDFGGWPRTAPDEPALCGNRAAHAFYILNEQAPSTDPQGRRITVTQPMSIATAARHHMRCWMAANQITWNHRPHVWLAPYEHRGTAWKGSKQAWQDWITFWIVVSGTEDILAWQWREPSQVAQRNWLERIVTDLARRDLTGCLMTQGRIERGGVAATMKRRDGSTFEMSYSDAGALTIDE